VSLVRMCLLDIVASEDIILFICVVLTSMVRQLRQRPLKRTALLRRSVTSQSIFNLGLIV
jgi:hypothetical protein